MTSDKKKATGYDKYIDWKFFIFPVILLFAVMAMPPTRGMRDVATLFAVGPRAVLHHVSQELFQKKPAELEQWQLLTCQIMEKSASEGSVARQKFLKRDAKWCKSSGIPVERENLEQAQRFVGAMTDTAYETIMKSATSLRTGGLSYDNLSDSNKELADKGTWKLKVALAITVFTVFCFVTACIPLPAVAFCTGVILTFSGVVSRTEVAAMYWDDAVWFIMGSLMFAAAMVKTGIDRRICMMLFKRLAVPNAGAITLLFIYVIALLSAFVSDHALAAIFLPIGLILYRGSTGKDGAPDPELGKMLMITICMGANIGGFGAPSGGARNIIMMTYMQDMFGFDMGYLQWVTYAMPFVFIMMPLTWLVIRWRFKPAVTDLTPAMTMLKDDITRMGKWSRQQIITLTVFFIMVWLWLTEKEFYDLGIYPIRLGIGIVAVAGGMAFIMTGVVNWRDYHEKVDWGVVWLYAGAVLFGKILDKTGAAYYLASTLVSGLAQFGFDHGLPLLAASGLIPGIITQFMADGPAAACVGPITLNMANFVHPGTVMLPFMTMATACASSFAYCLVIGTPPNAIIYASGLLEPKDFLRAGVPLWFASNIVLLLLMAFYWVPRGFAGLPGF